MPEAPRVPIQTQARITYALRSDTTVHSCYSFGPVITKLPVSYLSIELKKKIKILCACKWHENYFFKFTSWGKKTHGSSSDMMGKDDWLIHSDYESGSWYFHPVLHHKSVQVRDFFKKIFLNIWNMYFWYVIKLFFSILLGFFYW